VGEGYVNLSHRTKALELIPTFLVPDKKKPSVLFTTWLSAFSGPVLLPVIPKLFQIAFLYAQPFLINHAIDLAAKPQGLPYNNIGYGLIGAYALVYTGVAVSIYHIVFYPANKPEGLHRSI
jgi:hypothetical protein